MTLLKLRLPVVSLAVPLPIAKDAGPIREMPVSITPVALLAFQPMMVPPKNRPEESIKAEAPLPT
jgi:hypothetical protein